MKAVWVILFSFFSVAYAMGDPTFLPMNSIPSSQVKPGFDEMKGTTSTLNQIDQNQDLSPQEQQDREFNLNDDQKQNRVKPILKEKPNE